MGIEEETNPPQAMNYHSNPNLEKCPYLVLNPASNKIVSSGGYPWEIKKNMRQKFTQMDLYVCSLISLAFGIL